MKMKKIMVKHTLDRYIDLEGDIDSVIKRLKEYKKEYKDKKLEIEKRYGYENETYFTLAYLEIETDEEFQKRKAEEEKWEKMRIENAMQVLKAVGKLK